MKRFHLKVKTLFLNFTFVTLSPYLPNYFKFCSFLELIALLNSTRKKRKSKKKSCLIVLEQKERVFTKNQLNASLRSLSFDQSVNTITKSTTESTEQKIK